MINTTLRNKVALAMVLLAAFVTIVSVATTVWLLRRNMRAEILKRGDFAAHQYLDRISTLLVSESLPELTAYLVNEMLNHRDISYMIVFNRNRALLAHTFFGPLPGKIIDYHHRIPHMQNHILEVLTMPDGQKVYDIELPLMYEAGWLRVGFNKSFIDSSVQQLDRYVLLIFLPVAVVTFILSLRLTDHLIRPIEDLKEQAHALGEGNFDARVHTVKRDELGALAQTFNSMAEQLSRITVNRDYFDNIIAHIAALLIVIDEKGLITFVNNAVTADLGYPLAELIGQPINRLLTDDEEDLSGTELVNLVKVGAVLDYDTYFVASSGEKVPVILSGTFIEDPEGAPGNLVLVAKNATERRKAEQILQQANTRLRKNERALKHMMFDMRRTYDELKNTHAQLIQSEKLASLGQLSAGVAHEINNPLGFITNNMHILAEYIAAYKEVTTAGLQLTSAVEKGDWEAAKAKCEELRNLEEQLSLNYICKDVDDLIEQSKIGTERIKRIVQDLKTIARKDEGQMALHNIEEVIDGVTNIVWNEIKYKAELKKEYGHIPLVRCNSQKLGQVFIALLVNASQAIQDKGEITVRTYRNGKYACVEVSDTGDGIDPKNLEHIFDPFFTTKPVGIGTGLGLSISHEIITGHNGKLDVKSEIGKGTTFTIRLPLAESDSDVPRNGVA